MKFKISTFCILLVLIFSFQTFAEVKKARIVSFQKEEVEEGIEIFLSAEYCLRNSKLFATVRNTITGEVSEYEIERIFYDIEKLDAQFTGIIPANIKTDKITFRIVNYEESEYIEKNYDLAAIESTAAEIEENQKESEFSDNLMAFLKTSSAAQGKTKEEEQAAEEMAQNVLVVVVLLPILMESINSNDDNNNANEIDNNEKNDGN